MSMLEYKVEFLYDIIKMVDVEAVCKLCGYAKASPSYLRRGSVFDKEAFVELLEDEGWKFVSNEGFEDKSHVSGFICPDCVEKTNLNKE